MGQEKRRSVLDAYPDARRARAVTQESEPANSSIIVKVIAMVVLMVVIGAGSAYLIKSMRSSQPAGPLVGDDQRVYKMIGSYGIDDVKTWLAGYDGRMVMGMNRQQAERMSDTLTGLGAKRVLAFTGGVMTMAIAVELPDDPARRKEVFKWCIEHYPSDNPAGNRDAGQKYFLMLMHA